MTGLRHDDEDNSFVIHWDGDTDDVAEDGEPSRPAFPFHRRFRYQLIAMLLLTTICLTAYGYGAATYHPASRLPALVFATADPLYGTNSTVAAELQVVRDNFEEPRALQLEAVGPVFHVTLPRTVADRLFGKRDETVTVFSARSPEGESRFLVASAEGVSAVFAIEAPLGLSRRDQPTGIFLALDPTDAVLGPLITAVEEMLSTIGRLDAVEVSPDDLYVFAPFQDADVAALQSRVEANRVASHLAGEIAAVDGDVSLATPAFLLIPRPSRGTINALYHPARRLIMEPLWGGSSTASLAHELVHAYIDAVVVDEDELLTGAAIYFEQSHPVLHGEVVGDLYESLDRQGRAEETLAFVVGAIAAQQTKTVSTQRLLENQGNLAISEPILFSDVALLIEAGLLPPCMRPGEGQRGAITHDFYEAAQAACR